MRFVRNSLRRVVLRVVGSHLIPGSRPDMLTLEPDSWPNGYLTRADHVVRFLAGHLAPELAGSLLRTVAASSAGASLRPAQLMTVLRPLLRRCVGGDPTVARVLLRITAGIGFSSREVTMIDVQEARGLWKDFSEAFSEGDAAARAVFEWTED